MGIGEKGETQVAERPMRKEGRTQCYVSNAADKASLLIITTWANGRIMPYSTSGKKVLTVPHYFTIMLECSISIYLLRIMR